MNLIQAHHLVLIILSLFLLNNQAYAADINAGKDKAGFCLNCHGKGGNSSNPQFPSLAGQHSLYLEYQLKAFQSGQRTNSMMQGIASNLSKQDISNIAAYFSSLQAKSVGGGDESLANKGQAQFAMCTGCHGKAANGRGGFPKLAGQQAKYIEKQLLDFKNRSRKGGPMNGVASSLSEQTIKEIAAYLANL